MAALQQYLKENCQEFKLQISKKVKDKNCFVAESINEPKRQHVSYPVHQLTFLGAFGKLFYPHFEKVSQHMEMYQLLSGRRCAEIFGINAVANSNKDNDWALLLPQMVVKLSLSDKLSLGDIVMPVDIICDDNKKPSTVIVFSPAVPDDTGYERISLRGLFGVQGENDIVPFLPVIGIEGYPVTTTKGDDYISIKSGSPLEVGDYLIVRGQGYKVRHITEDDAFTSQYSKKNIVTIWGVFKNNVNAQKLRFRKMPKFSGWLHTVHFSKLARHKVFDIKFTTNSNGNNHGSMELAFHSVLFNSLGMMIHDRAVSQDQLKEIVPEDA